MRAESKGEAVGFKERPRVISRGAVRLKEMRAEALREKDRCRA
jgi:hypothetical protein